MEVLHHLRKDQLVLVKVEETVVYLYTARKNNKSTCGDMY